MNLHLGNWASKTAWITVLALPLVFLSCAEDQTSKKRKSKGGQNYNNQQGQRNPNGQFNNQQQQNGNFNNQNNNQNGQGPNNTYKALGGNDACGAKNFSKSFTSSLTKTVAIFTVSGDGGLTTTNTNDGLELDVKINNINVVPFDVGGLTVQSINKVVGKRTFFKYDQGGLESLKAEGGVWESTHCLMGVANTYTFPYDGATITVDFSPGLPFAPYPDKVSQEFDSAAQSGLNFTGITGRITNIDGTAPPGFAVDFEATGSVSVSKEGSGYKVAFDFGGFDNIEKMGLFDHTIYEFNGDDIRTVKAQVPIKVPPLNTPDTVNLEFN